MRGRLLHCGGCDALVPYRNAHWLAWGGLLHADRTLDSEFVFGAVELNERFDDEAKLERLKQIEAVMLLPYKTKARVIEPMLKQIMDSEVDEDNLEKLLEDYKNENIDINYGELWEKN